LQRATDDEGLKSDLVKLVRRTFPDWAMESAAALAPEVAPRRHMAVYQTLNKIVPTEAAMEAVVVDSPKSTTRKVEASTTKMTHRMSQLASLYSPEFVDYYPYIATYEGTYDQFVLANQRPSKPAIGRSQKQQQQNVLQQNGNSHFLSHHFAPQFFSALPQHEYDDEEIKERL